MIHNTQRHRLIAALSVTGLIAVWPTLAVADDSGAGGQQDDAAAAVCEGGDGSTDCDAAQDDSPPEGIQPTTTPNFWGCSQVSHRPQNNDLAIMFAGLAIALGAWRMRGGRR